MKKFFAILMSALMILSCVAVMTVTTSAADYTAEEAAKLTSFPEDTFKSYFAGPNQTQLIYNDDGSITFKGTWDATTAPLDPFVSFNYSNFLRRCVDKKLENVPTANNEYGAIVMKVKIDASVAGNFCLFIASGEERSISSATPTFTPDLDAEGTGDFEYLIFDIEGYTDGLINVMRLDWVDGVAAASEDNVGASMTLYEFSLHENYDAALEACGFEVPTEPEKTEAPETEAPSEAASDAESAVESADKEDKSEEKEESEKTTKVTCGAGVISASAVMLIVAASAAVVLKKKED